MAAITNLSEYYKSIGKSLPPLSERAKIFAQLFPDSQSGYTGNPKQNEALLQALLKSSATNPKKTSATGNAPIANLKDILKKAWDSLRQIFSPKDFCLPFVKCPKSQNSEQKQPVDDINMRTADQVGKMKSVIDKTIKETDVQPGYPDANGNTEGVTWCNRAAHRILERLGYDTSAILDPQGINWTTANEMSEHASQNSELGKGVVELTPEQAKERARQGIAVIAIASNSNGPGHIGVVYPSDGDEIMIGQAGSKNGVFTVNKAFGSLTTGVRYYELPKK